MYQGYNLFANIQFLMWRKYKTKFRLGYGLQWGGYSGDDQGFKGFSFIRTKHINQSMGVRWASKWVFCPDLSMVARSSANNLWDEEWEHGGSVSGLGR